MQKSKIKKLLIPLAILTLVGGATLVSTTAMAESDSENGYPPIIQKLVEKFGLNQDEVEEVFTQHREERRAQGQFRFEERLNQAVEDGQLTQAQKETILTKKDEMRAECQSMAGLSWEERKQARETHHEEMEAWAQQNGIEMEGLFGMGMGNPKGGHRGGFGFGK